LIYTTRMTLLESSVRLQLKCDGTRWRTGGEVKGKLANGVGSQYSSHYHGIWCIQHYYRWCSHLGYTVVDWTDASPPADLNGFVRLAERRNLFSARVPSHLNWSLLSLSISSLYSEYYFVGAKLLFLLNTVRLQRKKWNPSIVVKRDWRMIFQRGRLLYWHNINVSVTVF